MFCCTMPQSSAEPSLQTYFCDIWDFRILLVCVHRSLSSLAELLKTILGANRSLDPTILDPILFSSRDMESQLSFFGLAQSY